MHQTQSRACLYDPLGGGPQRQLCKDLTLPQLSVSPGTVSDWVHLIDRKSPVGFWQVAAWLDIVVGRISRACRKPLSDFAGDRWGTDPRRETQLPLIYRGSSRVDCKPLYKPGQSIDPGDKLKESARGGESVCPWRRILSISSESGS